MTFSDITDAMELCSRLTLMARGTETCNYYKVNINNAWIYYRKFGSYETKQHKRKISTYILLIFRLVAFKLLIHAP